MNKNLSKQRKAEIDREQFDLHQTDLTKIVEYYIKILSEKKTTDVHKKYRFSYN